MGDLLRKVRHLERQIEDINYQETERISSKYREERIRYLTVIFAQANGLIPDDYTDPEFERAVRIIHNLPKTKNPKTSTLNKFISKEERKRLDKLFIECETDEYALKKYIPNFDEIKLKSPEEVRKELFKKHGIEEES